MPLRALLGGQSSAALHRLRVTGLRRARLRWRAVRGSPAELNRALGRSQTPCLLVMVRAVEALEAAHGVGGAIGRLIASERRVANGAIDVAAERAVGAPEAAVLSRRGARRRAARDFSWRGVEPTCRGARRRAGRGPSAGRRTRRGGARSGGGRHRRAGAHRSARGRATCSCCSGAGCSRSRSCAGRARTALAARAIRTAAHQKSTDHRPCRVSSHTNLPRK